MTLADYITFRLPNWTDYARHQCKVQHLEGWADDLINEIVIDLLRKPAEKTAGMLARETRKIVNGRPTTELDKFVLTMIKTNARSHFASFRKNTVGQKIIGEYGPNVEVATFCELGYQHDAADDSTYDDERAAKLDRMHAINIQRLKAWGYSREVLNWYMRHFMQSEPARTQRQKMIINEITNFLIQQKHDCLESNENHDPEFADYSERFEGIGNI